MMAEYIYKPDLEKDVMVRQEEIIRCRDCKHFRDVPMSDGNTGHRCSGVFTFVEPTPDGFCA